MQVYLTVDVECYRGDYEREVYGGGQGLPYILRVLGEQRAKATFFVEALGATQWGLEPTKRICSDILSAGQEVQLHIHPSVANIDGFKDDTDVLWMQSLDKQAMLMEKGLEILDKCGGKGIKAFRAGDFAADENTLAAMQKCGLTVSSNRDLDTKCSTRSKLNNHFPVSNDVSQKDGVVDVPLTCVRSPVAFLDGKYRHLEISAVSTGELACSVETMETMGYSSVCLLTHPAEFYSRKTGETIQKNVARLEWFCEKFARRMSVLSQIAEGAAQSESIAIPRVPLLLALGRVIEQGLSRLTDG